ncbi:MAG: phenylacetate--CoA ligase family protein [Butyrivibrio sp.]|nr:phenylacetate--CoA ligase family protein [Butyrivibrio sp.]
MQSYIRSRTGCGSRKALDAWQTERVREAMEYARTHSAFYKRHLKGIDADTIRTYDDPEKIPLTPSEALRERPQDFLCIPASRVDRIVTLFSSGTTGRAKRIFFTASELENTIDFFRHGMRTLADPGDTVMILFPCDTPDGIGDLLSRGLSRAHITSIPHGAVADIGETCERIVETKSNVLVGIPVQILALAEYIASDEALSEQIAIKSVLLSADTTPPALCRRIEKLLMCDVYTHFGMTEAGYGMAIDCDAHQGLHIREEALLVEVIDPESGAVLKPGEQGEFVLTTLAREAMPLIRYRTGDLGLLVTGKCACGSFIKRMLPSGGRKNRMVMLPDGRQITQWEADEAVFGITGIVDYQIRQTEDAFEMTVLSVRPLTRDALYNSLMRAGFLQPEGSGNTKLLLQVIGGFSETGTVKRRVQRT